MSNPCPACPTCPPASAPAVCAPCPTCPECPLCPACPSPVTPTPQPPQASGVYWFGEERIKDQPDALTKAEYVGIQVTDNVNTFNSANNPTLQAIAQYIGNKTDLSLADKNSICGIACGGGYGGSCCDCNSSPIKAIDCSLGRTVPPGYPLP